MAEVAIGNLKIIGVKKSLGAGVEDDFRFAVPPGGVGLMKESTFHLLRSAALPAAAEGGSFFTSEAINVKSLEVTKQGASERVNLLSGECNIKEFAGTGMLAHLFTVIETLENNEDVIIKVRNDDTVAVLVNLTLWFAVKPRERRIAAQEPSPEEVADIRRAAPANA